MFPEACGWTINNDKYELVWFLEYQLPSSVVDIILQGKYLLNENKIFLTNTKLNECIFSWIILQNIETAEDDASNDKNSDEAHN